MINRSMLKFHETFQPEIPYLARILDLASNKYAGTKEEISNITGIPTGKQKGKVEPHIKYASYMDLIRYSMAKGVYSLCLTKLGNEVFMQDKFLHEHLTRWLCHYGIARPEEGAPQWTYVVHSGHTGFNQINSSDWHLRKASKQLGINIDFEELFGVVRRTYIDGMFSEINYLKWDDGIEYIEHTCNPELIYVYAYALIDSWEHLLPNNREISIMDITQKLGFDRIFNFGIEEIDSVLNDLETIGVVKINRQLFPLTVVCTENIEAIIPKLYSCLL